jgi:S1-C subfamily serine protease
VPFDDADDDDALEGGAPLPPDDRLWRHPSEVGAGLGASNSGADDAATTAVTPTRVWAVAVVAGLIGSALSLGVVVAAGGLTSEVVEKPVVEKVAVRPIAELSSSNATETAAAVAKTVSPSVARVDGVVDNAPVAGSAILLRDDGYLVTNAHVVDKVGNLQVTFADASTVPARVVGVDSMNDIAVLKVDRDHLAVAVLGTATDLNAGDRAIAIGSPLGLAGGPSITAGLVSAIGRRVTSASGVELRDMIETDARTASGSSGGALCDGSGAVVGMTTSTDASSDPSAVAFAIPIDIVRAVAEDIIETGMAHHPWLGVEGADAAGGARLTKVVDQSPAAQAGLQSDDVVTSVNGVKVASMTAFVIALRSHHAGDAVTLEVLRASEPQAVTMIVTLGERHA